MQQLLVEAWQASGCTVVFVTHDVDEALVLGDRVVVLGRHGVVAEHRIEHPRDPDRPPGAERPRRDPRARSAATQSLAPGRPPKRSVAMTTTQHRPSPLDGRSRRSPERRELTCDVLVVGGGTAGTMAAITAAEAGADVLLLEKAHVRHSGALAMGMDGVNNAVIPGKATPEDYVAEITRANDGIVNQATVRQTATRGFDMVQRLEKYGVKFEKDEYGEYAVRRVHRSGSYVLPDARGQGRQEGPLPGDAASREIREQLHHREPGDAGAGAHRRAAGRSARSAFDTRSGEFVTVSAGAVILATGACGRLGLPASGYLYGTYENPTNAGDGYAMAYHAGAELSGIECFQVNPLIKDYNGPACAYVANPFGGYQVNAEGDRFVDCDYWSGQMMAEVKEEIDSARGPIYLKLTPPARRDDHRSSRGSCTTPSGRPAAPSTTAAVTTTAPTTSRCTSPRSGCAAATRPPASGSTRTRRPRCPGCTPPATWPASRTTT